MAIPLLSTDAAVVDGWQWPSGQTFDAMYAPGVHLDPSRLAAGDSKRFAVDESLPLAHAERCGFGFKLFLLLNAVLILRPAEFIPALESWPIYYVVIVGCILTAGPAMLRPLRVAALKEQPGVCFVLAMLPAIALSRLSHLQIYEARLASVDFLKVLIYFLLLIGLVTSPARLRTFLLVLAALVTTTAAIAVLNYHGIIQVESMKVIVDGRYDESGNFKSDLRLQATGIFSDPNDLSLVLVTSLMACAHVITRPGRAAARAACMLMVPVLAYALLLTRSRGGFLALMAASATLLVARKGWRRAIPYAVIGLPILVVLFGGRSTNIDVDNTDDTAQGRIHLWRDALTLMRGPQMLFGIGVDRLPEEIGLVAHNSYVHAFSETGLFGGSMFASALLVPIATIRGLKTWAGNQLSPEVADWRPCILAIGAGYAMGICSLSRVYQVSTYVAIGTLIAYCRMATAEAPDALPRLGPRLLWKAALASAGVLFTFHVIVRVFAR